MPELFICTACNSAATCLFKQAALNPIWYCDEFGTYAPRSEKTLLGVLSEAEASGARTAVADAQAGLCSDCGARNDCVHQVPGAKKVYCEGYR